MGYSGIKANLMSVSLSLCEFIKFPASFPTRGILANVKLNEFDFKLMDLTYSGAFGLFVFVYSSDHFHERSLHTVTSMALALIGLIVMYISSNPHLRYGFTHVWSCGCFSAGPLIVGWLAKQHTPPWTPAP